MARRGSSARTGLVVGTLCLVALTSSATAFAVLSSTATVNPDLGLSPLLPGAGLPPAGGGVVLLGSVPISGSTAAAGRLPSRPTTPVLRGHPMPLAFPSAFAGLPVVGLPQAPDGAAPVDEPPAPEQPSVPGRPTALPAGPSDPTAPVAPSDPDGA
ncbi:MAG: hypothetical protein JWN08_3825, partial [Frankiales bacterium]|nr:hypothetical protein [Frankiales bacterium]